MLRHLALAVVLSCVGLGWADDRIPPPWDRQEPAALFAEYDFRAAPVPTGDVRPGGLYFPEQLSNPFGGQPAGYDPNYPYNGGVGSEWLPAIGIRPGIAVPAFDMEFWNPNAPVARPYKEMYIQVTWLPGGPDADGVAPLLEVTTTDPHTTLIEIAVVNEIPLEDGFFYTRWRVRIEPNPPQEYVRLLPSEEGGRLYLDQVVIDTICVPEPATVLLLAMALVCRRPRWA